MPITSVEEARYAIERADFLRDVNYLHYRIHSEITRLDNDTAPELQEVNCYLAEKLEELLHIPIKDKEDLESVEWLFNNGQLRTESEIEENNQQKADKEYVESGQWDSDCATQNALSMWVPLLICILLAVGFFAGEFGLSNPISWIAGIIVGAIPGCFFALIGGAISNSSNVRRGQKMNVSSNHPRMQKEINNLRAAKIAGTAATIHTVYHAKKTVEDITNVDGWKEMK